MAEAYVELGGARLSIEEYLESAAVRPVDGPEVKDAPAYTHEGCYPRTEALSEADKTAFEGMVKAQLDFHDAQRRCEQYRDYIFQDQATFNRWWRWMGKRKVIEHG